MPPLHATSGVQAGTAQSVQRRVTGWMVSVQLPAGASDFSLLRSVQTGSGLHPLSHPMGNVDYFPWGEAAGARR
jgi:hypothetical protein